jgi:hypothetical protein
MRLGLFIALITVIDAALAASASARTPQSCNTAAANTAARDQLLPYDDRHAPDFYGQYCGSAKLR